MGKVYSQVCLGISATLTFFQMLFPRTTSSFNKYGWELAIKPYCYLAVERINTKIDQGH